MIYTTRKMPSTTQYALVTFGNFQRQGSLQDFHHESKWTSLPTISPPPKKHFEPQKMNTWFGIDNILRRNNSDYHKIGELIHKVNQTGSLSHVNVFNSSSEDEGEDQDDDKMKAKGSDNVTYVHPYESQDPGKDSKELKVQFVLDCDLKNGGHKGHKAHDHDSDNETYSEKKFRKRKPTTTPDPMFNPMFHVTESSVKQNTVQYANYANNVHSVFNFQRVPIKQVTKPTKPPPKYMYPLSDDSDQYYRPTRHTRKASSTTTTRKTTSTSTTTTKKPRVKNVYVDPPLVAEVSDVFENMYNYFEDAFTTKVKTGPKTPTISKKPTPTKNTNMPQQRRKKPKSQVPSRRKDRRRNGQYNRDRNRRRRPITKRSTIPNVITPPTYSQTYPPTYPPPPAAYPQPYPQLYPSVIASPFPPPVYPQMHPFPHIPQVVPQVKQQAFDATSAPNYRYTQDYSGQNAQKLTTNIQVTSQYVGKEPPTQPPANPDSESSEYGDALYDDDYSDEDYNREGEESEEDESEEEDDDFGLSFVSANCFLFISFHFFSAVKLCAE